jgi:hypothetical protein
MSNLLFLGFAVVFTAIGCTVIWLRQRKPTGVDTSVDAFQRELRALAPDRDITRTRPDEDGRPG